MGNETTCSLEYDGTSGQAKALLETDELIVRAPFGVKVSFSEIRQIDADNEHLRIRWDSHVLSLAIGPLARKWAEKIRNPKSLVDKLGVKSGQKISISGKLDAKFIEELQRRGAEVGDRVRRHSDIIFVAVDKREQLDRLAVSRSRSRRMARSGSCDRRELRRFPIAM